MQELVNKQRQFFNSNKTKDINFRIEQLKKLKKLLKENEQRMEDAIYADFSKPAVNELLSASRASPVES